MGTKAAAFAALRARCFGSFSSIVGLIKVASSGSGKIPFTEKMSIPAQAFASIYEPPAA